MNLNVQLCYINWETKDLRILPSENIGDKKKQEKQEDSTWKCNGRILKDNKTFNDYNIEENDVIYSSRKNVGGGCAGFGLNTIDITKNRTKIVEFDPNAPFYRYVENGMSIQAICGNNCRAKDEIVYCKIGFVRDYDLLYHLGDIKCPACKSEVYPKNSGFLRCNYKIDYEKWENNKKSSGTIEGRADNKFILFSEYSGNANFTKLVFNVY